MRKNILLTESQLRKILINEFKIYKGKEGIDKTQQGDWEQEIKCPECGKPMFLHLVLNDEKGEKELLGTVDKKGNIKDTEYQSVAIYKCPHCFKTIAKDNMA